MKAITLTQPWATLVAIGAKKIETRSWNTNYRGPLAIHSAKRFPFNIYCLCFSEPFKSYLGDYLGELYLSNHRFPTGCIIATCDLIAVQRIDNSDWKPGQLGWQKGKYFWEATEDEKRFGDYTVGRYMWFLANIQMLSEPISIKGALGLWEWTN